MSKTCVVVAESARARILIQTYPSGELLEWKDLTHPDSRLHARDLVSDRQGRSFDSSGAGARHAMEPKTTPHQAESASFAREVAARLDAALAQGAFDDLVLIAPPHFLGLLTEHLGDAAQRLVSTRIHKNLVRHSVADIARHVAAAARNAPQP